MPDAAYYREWRRQHPEYVERERERSRSRSRAPEQRRAERERAKAKAQAKADHRESARKHYRRNAETERVKARERMRLAYKGVTAEKLAYNRHRKAQARAERLLSHAREATGRVIRPDARTELHDPLHEDAVSIACVVLVEKKNRPVHERLARAEEAVRAFVKQERLYRWYASYDLNEELLAG